MSEDQANQRTCATCGEPAGPSDRYCRHCGAPLAPATAAPDQDQSRAEFPTQRVEYLQEPDAAPELAPADEEPVLGQPTESAEEPWRTPEPAPPTSRGTSEQDRSRATWQTQSFSDIREEKRPNRNMWWIVGIAAIVLLLFCCCMLFGVAFVAAEDNALHRELDQAFRLVSSARLLG